MIPQEPCDTTTLVLRRTFKATRQRVFRACIEPDALERWLRPRGLGMTVSHLDARVGGSFRFDLENGASIIGTYLLIVPPEKLVFTWASRTIRGQETLVTLDFLDQGPVTEVVLTHERISTPEQRSWFEGGWPSLLNALAETLTSLAYS